jgi:ABC-type uncharacterized transport system permease subunit
MFLASHVSISFLLENFVFLNSISKTFLINFIAYTAVMDMVITNLQQQRQVTEQLRREAALRRITVSRAVEDIMKYITEHEQEDCLLVGFSSQKSNPFREKSTCIVL